MWNGQKLNGTLDYNNKIKIKKISWQQKKENLKIRKCLNINLSILYIHYTCSSTIHMYGIYVCM